MASLPDLLSKERIVAPPTFNRWLVPPAALAVSFRHFLDALWSGEYA